LPVVVASARRIMVEPRWSERVAYRGPRRDRQRMGKSRRNNAVVIPGSCNAASTSFEEPGIERAAWEAWVGGGGALQCQPGGEFR
jgi:hypothetical protein